MRRLIVSLVFLCGWCLSSSSSSSASLALRSLSRGTWVKFICGASNQDLPLVRNLCLLYTQAGVDCIDLSADPAVVRAADEGISRAMALWPGCHRPLLMVSVNDAQDLHFRKASFDPASCPADCSRPCEKVCPAWAIPPLTSSPSGEPKGDGVISERCYGCGRCIPTCPLGLIDEVSYVANRSVVSGLFASGMVDAIEVHTTHGQEASFAELWAAIGSDILPAAKVVAVSFPDLKSETLPYLSRLQAIMTRQPHWPVFAGVQIWQTDGRPMSGDVGRGTAHASTQFALQLLREASATANDGPIKLSARGRQFLQLAGGTNDYSAVLAKSQGLSGAAGFGGFAFGGYARREIGTVLRSLEDRQPGANIEDYPAELELCARFADNLVRGVKL